VRKKLKRNAKLFEEHRTYVEVVASLRADHYSTLYIVSYSYTKNRGANTSYSLNRIALCVIISLPLLKHVYMT